MRRWSQSPAAAGPPWVTPALAAAAVRAIRANDRADAPPPAGVEAPESDTAVHPVPTMGQNDVMAVLRSAIAADSHPCGVGYADPTGVAGERRVEPLRLAGGYLTALDLRSETITSFALARITGALPASPPPSLPPQTLRERTDPPCRRGGS